MYAVDSVSIYHHASVQSHAGSLKVGLPLSLGWLHQIGDVVDQGERPGVFRGDLVFRGQLQAVAVQIGHLQGTGLSDCELQRVFGRDAPAKRIQQEFATRIVIRVVALLSGQYLCCAEISGNESICKQRDVEKTCGWCVSIGEGTHQHKQYISMVSMRHYRHQPALKPIMLQRRAAPAVIAPGCQASQDGNRSETAGEADLRGVECWLRCMRGWHSR